MTQFQSGGVTLLLALQEFEARIGGQTHVLGEYMRELTERLDAFYSQHSSVQGHRDLVVTIAPGGRWKIWLSGRDRDLDVEEQEAVADIMTQMTVPSTVLRPILFAVTYSLGGIEPAAMYDLQFPAEMVQLIPADKDGIDTEKMLELIWADSDSGAP